MSAPRVAPRRHGRLRLSIFALAERAFALAGGRSAYRRRHLAPGRFAWREVRVPVAGLPAALEGFSIAHLSDLHAGPFLGRGDLAHVVERVAAEAPDVVALTGDYVTHDWRDALLPLEDLARLRPRRGAFAVFGNHDYRDRLEGRIVEAYAEAGIRFLRNAGTRVEVGGAAVAFVGLEDLEEGRELDLAAARGGLRAGDVEVVLCHNPLGAARLARPGCALVLAGHTHGCQVDLPLLRALGPPHPGARVRIGPTMLVVSRGLGVVGAPLRVGARAEVVLARLERARGTPGP